MLCARCTRWCIWLVFVVQISQAIFFGDGPGPGRPRLQWFVNPLCGPAPLCPMMDCRLLETIVLGYCCGCALPIDHIPMVCPRNVPCPYDVDRLCYRYNFLMDCCC